MITYDKIGRLKDKRSQSFAAKINISIKSNALLWQLFFNWQWLKSHRNLICIYIYNFFNALWLKKVIFHCLFIFFTTVKDKKATIYKCMCWVSLEQPRHRRSSEGAHYRARVELWNNELHSHVRCVELDRWERHWHLRLAVGWDDAWK